MSSRTPGKGVSTTSKSAVKAKPSDKKPEAPRSAPAKGKASKLVDADDAKKGTKADDKLAAKFGLKSHDFGDLSGSDEESGADGFDSDGSSDADLTKARLDGEGDEEEAPKAKSASKVNPRRTSAAPPADDGAESPRASRAATSVGKAAAASAAKTPATASKPTVADTKATSTKKGALVAAKAVTPAVAPVVVLDAASSAKGKKAAEPAPAPASNKKATPAPPSPPSDDEEEDSDEEAGLAPTSKRRGLLDSDEEDGDDDGADDGDAGEADFSDGDDEDDDEEGDSDDDDDAEGDLEEDWDGGDIVKAQKRLDKRIARVKAESEAELKAAASASASAGVEKFDLPTAAELEAERAGAPNLAAIKKRIEAVIHVLSDFRTLRDPYRSRSEYVDCLAQDITDYYGYNRELIDMFLTLFSPAECRLFLEENEKPRPTVIRVNTLKSNRRALGSALSARGVNMEAVGPWSKVGLKVFESSVPIGATPEYLAGHYMLQMAASFVPCMALDPQPGEKVLDMASAPGGKTTYLGQLMGNKGVLVANELKKERLSSLVANLARMGITNSVVVCMDGRKLPECMKGFDRVLLDAPCTGLGIISRDPSVRTQKTREDILKMAHLQKELALAALDCIDADSPQGGVLVYSTCSVTVEENEQVVNYILKKRHVKLLPIFPEGHDDVGRPGLTAHSGGAFHPSLSLTRRFYPHVQNMDGFYVAKIKKLSNAKPKTADDEEEEEEAATAGSKKGKASGGAGARMSDEGEDEDGEDDGDDDDEEGGESKPPRAKSAVAPTPATLKRQQLLAEARKRAAAAAGAFSVPIPVAADSKPEKAAPSTKVATGKAPASSSASSAAPATATGSGKDGSAAVLGKRKRLEDAASAVKTATAPAALDDDDEEGMATASSAKGTGKGKKEDKKAASKAAPAPSKKPVATAVGGAGASPASDDDASDDGGDADGGVVDFVKPGELSKKKRKAGKRVREAKEAKAAAKGGAGRRPGSAGPGGRASASS